MNWMPVSLCMFACLFLSVCLSVCLCVSLCVSLSVCHYQSVSFLVTNVWVDRKYAVSPVLHLCMSQFVGQYKLMHMSGCQIDEVLSISHLLFSSIIDCRCRQFHHYCHLASSPCVKEYPCVFVCDIHWPMSRLIVLFSFLVIMSLFNYSTCQKNSIKVPLPYGTTAER